MTVAVFVGPTLTQDDLTNYPSFNFLPPVAQGDVYKIVRDDIHAIGIIDGYFEGVPSVWHKEVLWAMEQGIHVFGSASMGALRAAELHEFGMQGVGEIFQSFADGVLEDDDEVALVHGPEDSGFVALSHPMVNIRATLDNARKQSVVDESHLNIFLNSAKNLFYPQRNWDEILKAAVEQGASEACAKALQQWLPDNHIDLKRRDALAMLSHMRETLEQLVPAPTPSFQFEWTQVWDSVVAEHDASVRGADISIDLIIDELRLLDDAYRTTRDQAILRRIANKEFRHKELFFDARQVPGKAREFRMQHGLISRKQLDEYFELNDLDDDQFATLMENEVRLQQLIDTNDWNADLVSVLKVNNKYQTFLSRAKKKQTSLEEHGYEMVDVADTGLSPPQLLRWYFQSQLNRRIPDNIEEFAASIGLSNRKMYYRLLAREYVYLEKQSAIEGREGQ